MWSEAIGASTPLTRSSSGSPWRILYNLTLAAVVIISFAIGYPQPKSTLTVDFCRGSFMLAVIANVACCAAYMVDIFAQASGFRELRQR